MAKSFMAVNPDDLYAVNQLMMFVFEDDLENVFGEPHYRDDAASQTYACSVREFPTDYEKYTDIGYLLSLNVVVDPTMAQRGIEAINSGRVLTSNDETVEVGMKTFGLRDMNAGAVPHPYEGEDDSGGNAPDLPYTPTDIEWSEEHAH